MGERGHGGGDATRQCAVLAVAAVGQVDVQRSWGGKCDYRTLGACTCMQQEYMLLLERMARPTMDSAFLATRCSACAPLIHIPRTETGSMAVDAWQGPHGRGRMAGDAWQGPRGMGRMAGAAWQGLPGRGCQDTFPLRAPITLMPHFHSPWCPPLSHRPPLSAMSSRSASCSPSPPSSISSPPSS